MGGVLGCRRRRGEEEQQEEEEERREVALGGVRRRRGGALAAGQWARLARALWAAEAGRRRRALRARLWALLGHYLNSVRILDHALPAAHHQELRRRFGRLGAELRRRQQ